ncbi:MAG: hypothetical protein AAFY11_14940 [Cyanobacteria bacterium J06641_5]
MPFYFDAAYRGLFKCNLRRIQDRRHLGGYLTLCCDRSDRKIAGMSFQEILGIGLKPSIALLPLWVWATAFGPALAIADSRSCQTAIATSIQKLDRVANTSIEFSNLDRHGYRNYPDGRSHQIKFGISGVGINDILNSPVFLKEVATQIVSNCDDLGLVGFGKFQAERGGKFFGMMSTGNVREFECITKLDLTHNPTAELAWGSILCP